MRRRGAPATWQRVGIQQVRAFYPEGPSPLAVAGMARVGPSAPTALAAAESKRLSTRRRPWASRGEIRSARPPPGSARK
jgi:hypothetical protein